MTQVYSTTNNVRVLAWAALQSRELDQRHLVEHLLSLDELEGLPICL